MITANLQTLWAALQSQKRFNLKSVQTGISLLRQLSHQKHKALKCICVHSPLSPRPELPSCLTGNHTLNENCGLKGQLEKQALPTAGESGLTTLGVCTELCVMGDYSALLPLGNLKCERM